MRIAFASTGEYVDQHFGSARFYQVYDLTDDGYEHVGMRRTEASCQGHCEGGFDAILDTLQDCDAIFVAKIGEGAASYVISKGKRVFEARGALEEILKELSTEDFLDGAPKETEHEQNI
jgi:predicted Fe-Mo cluster-binding NifX family protein